MTGFLLWMAFVRAVMQRYVTAADLPAQGPTATHASADAAAQAQRELDEIVGSFAMGNAREP